MPAALRGHGPFASTAVACGNVRRYGRASISPNVLNTASRSPTLSRRELLRAQSMQKLARVAQEYVRKDVLIAAQAQELETLRAIQREHGSEDGTSCRA
jgi:hypothetical protein